MKILVTGARGVLGRRVTAAAEAAGHEVMAVGHWECPIDSLGPVLRLRDAFQPDAIINCAGRTDGPDLEMIAANAVGPHNLAYTHCRVVHMSTDCVFSGRTAGHKYSSDLPEPDTLYGRSKLLGEVEAANVLNVRGSFIDPAGGLLAWLLRQRGEVQGWTRAFWNGTSARLMSEKLVELAAGEQVGVVHVASQYVVTKADLLTAVVKLAGTEAAVVRYVNLPRVNRTLDPDIVVPQALEDEQLLEDIRQAVVPA